MFCNKNRQTQKFVLNLKIWIWNVTNQMIVFSAFIQSGYRGKRHYFSINWFPFQCSKINKYEDNFFQCCLCHIINLLLTKLVRSRWLVIGLVLFLRFMDLSVHKNAKRELDQYPAILTSRFVNNICITTKWRFFGKKSSSQRTRVLSALRNGSPFYVTTRLAPGTFGVDLNQMFLNFYKTWNINDSSKLKNSFTN